MGAVKGVVIFMGLLIVTLMGLIIYGFYQKSQNPDFKFFADDDAPTQVVQSTPSPAPKSQDKPTAPPIGTNALSVTSFGEVSLDLPGTARVMSASASANRLIMVIARDGQNADLVAVIDMNTGKVLGRVKTSP